MFDLRLLVPFTALFVLSTAFYLFVRSRHRLLSQSQADTEEPSPQNDWPEPPAKGASFSTLLKRHGGDVREALVAKRLSVECDADGEVERVFDLMMRGDFTDGEFAQLAALPKLRSLSLRGTKLTDRALESLEKFSSLEDLSIETADITDAGLQHLNLAPRLRSIGLQSVNVTGLGLQRLDQPETLETLALHKCPIVSETFELLGRFTNLSRLDLLFSEDACVDDNAAEGIARCKKLKSLNLNYTDMSGLTERGVLALTKLPELEDLELGEHRLSEASVDRLLGMSKLNSLVVRDDAITEPMLKRLSAGGVEVRHGRLRDFRREHNVLRYDGFDFEIDPGRSAMHVYLHPEDPAGVVVQIDVRCTDKYVPDYLQPASLEGPLMQFTGTVSDLPGKTSRADFDEDEVHPVLPDNPANIYNGMHAFPNHHILKILEQRGIRFLIEWTCEAKGSLLEGAKPVYVSGEIPLKGVTVWSKDTLTTEQAHKIAERHVPIDDMEEPRVRDQNGETHIEFPVEL